MRRLVSALTATCDSSVFGPNVWPAFTATAGNKQVTETYCFLSQAWAESWEPVGGHLRTT